MHIWIDGDACPNIIKDILFRASNRTETHMIVVANQLIRTPPSSFIKTVKVSAGFDVADNYIIQNIQKSDLVITADVPLADAVIQKGATALNPRGQMYSETNIKQRLAIRNLSEDLRSTGIRTKGPDKLTKSDIQAFANCLDQFLTRHQLNKN